MSRTLGIIEGFYGRPWGFDKRQGSIPFLKEYGFSFYIYAPKADPFLRERWQEPVPDELLAKLAQFGAELRAQSIHWGVGLSPFELHLNFDKQAKEALRRKLDQIQALQVDWLAILFDDMKGDFEDLADRQIEICHFVKEYVDFDRLLMCPSYYCFDPILEQVFGTMPSNYLEDLGHGLDSDIDVFWTGEKVCSEEYSPEHLAQVSQLLRRKPFIWDNYPVNDGARMSPFLHLSQTNGREHCHDEWVAGCAVNPMNEAFLSQIPLASLAKRPQDAKQALQAFEGFSEQFLGQQAAKEFKRDRAIFEEQGLLVLSEEQKATLSKKYQELLNANNFGYISELIEYLNGDYLFDLKDQVPTQLLWEG